MANFTLRELECFIAVAEELSFSAAARRLHLSQPPLSRHVAALEDRLGARLFERSKRHVRLTAAGQRLLEETRGVLPQLERAEAAIRGGDWIDRQRLEVGFVSALLSPDLMAVFEAFHHAHPKVRVTLHDLTPSLQIRAIREGQLDVGFLGLDPAERSPSVCLTPWRRERLCAFLPSGHRLADRDAIGIAELADQPLVFVSSQAAPAFASRLHRLFTEARLTARVVQEASRAQAVAMMALSGSSVALLPQNVGAIFPGHRPPPVLDHTGDPVWLDFMIASRRAPESAAVIAFLKIAAAVDPLACPPGKHA